MLKKYSFLITLAFFLVLSISILFGYMLLKNNGEKRILSTLEVLRSEQLTFLVTDRIVTQVIVQVDNSHWLTGTDKALIYTVVRLYYGVDLKKLTENDLERSGDTVFVKIPDPEILDISVNLTDVSVFESKSGIVRLVDLIKGENTALNLLEEFEIQARKLAEEEDMLPSREKILMNLNSFAPLFSEQTKLTIIFI